ncbi:MAG TPA: serine protease [Steroidobacteraceae bacterium]
MQGFSTTTRARVLRLALLAAVVGLWGPVRAQQAPDPDEGATTAGDESSDDADAAGAAEPEDAGPEAADDADHDAAVDDNPDDRADAAADDATDDTADTADADDDAVADDGAEAADDADAQAANYHDGSTPADDYMPAGWAPELPADVSDDVLPTDRTADPTGAGWVVLSDSSAAARPGDPGKPQRVRRGDYAGPSEIMVMQPQARLPATRHPADRDASPGKDTPYSFGGHPIDPGSAPWQAQIYRSLQKERPGVPRWKAQHNCGGTLIAPDWILTAAHCVDDMIDDREAGWRVRLGGQDLSREDGVTYAVDRWVRHSGYRNVGHPAPPKPPLSRPNMYSNDIALVHIKADGMTRLLADPKRVHPIELYRKSVKGNDEVTAIGWGMTENTAKSFSAVPLKVDLSVMDTAACQARPGYGPERIDGSVICAARSGQKTCRGDSGGPVILTSMKTATLVGLVSWGKNDCGGDGRPSVFTRVETYLGWIDQAMKLPETRASLP